MKRKIALIASKALGIIAVLFVSTSSMLWLHRPDIPLELQKNKKNDKLEVIS